MSGHREDPKILGLILSGLIVANEFGSRFKVVEGRFVV